MVQLKVAIEIFFLLQDIPEEEILDLLLAVQRALRAE